MIICNNHCHLKGPRLKFLIINRTVEIIKIEENKHCES